MTGVPRCGACEVPWDACTCGARDFAEADRARRRNREEVKAALASVGLKIRRPRGPRGTGKTRIKLAARLLEKGILVDPADIWEQLGNYRHGTWDVVRWGSNKARWATVDPRGRDHAGRCITLSSWSTMGDCVRYGVEFSDFNSHADGGADWNHVDLSDAKPLPTKAAP